MRHFILLIIISLFVGGYSAAVHAAGDSPCYEGMPGCQGFMQDNGDTNQNDQSGKAKDQNSNCQHCCSSHAAAYFSTEPITFRPQAVTLRPLSVLAYAGDHRFSLLRPPKILV
jgi:hypothetical protein